MHQNCIRLRMRVHWVSQWSQKNNQSKEKRVEGCEWMESGTRIGFRVDYKKP